MVSVRKVPAARDFDSIAQTLLSNARSDGGVTPIIVEGGRQLNQSADTNRGHITIGPDRRLSIALLEKADLSTFLHETGHAWLEIMGDLAESEGASERINSRFPESRGDSRAVAGKPSPTSRPVPRA